MTRDLRRAYARASRANRLREADRIGQVEVTASGIEFVRPIDGPTENLAVPGRTVRWRKDNPNALRTWTTAHGCVVQFWGMRVYYGRCADCSGLVTRRRDISGIQHRDGQTNIGRWPKYCDSCKTVRDNRHNDQARQRMRKLRAARYAERNDDLRGEGYQTLPRQGVAGTANGEAFPLGGDTPMEREERERWEKWAQSEKDAWKAAYD